MKRDLSNLDKQPFDLFIIGAGISGATLAWDATLRGLKVAMVDKGDFGSATTAATSKLIHGGMRYLKNGELGLVRESLQERRILQTVAAHLVRPLPFLIPTYRRGGNRRWMIKMGMVMYDWLSFDRNRVPDPQRRIPRHHMLSGAEAVQQEPMIPSAGLTGAAVYHDCQCEPDRLCLEFIRGAVDQGAQVINHVRVIGISCSKRRVEAVSLVDLQTGQRLDIKAKVVVNVGGPWADHLETLCGVGSGVIVRRSKGIHIVTRPLSRKHGIVFQINPGRHFFIIPWRNQSLIGTTDNEYLGDPDQISVSDQDVDDFIAEINSVCPEARLTKADVMYRYVGMRPLVDQDTPVYQASRKYEIVDHHQEGLGGFITAIGGKYTTSRNLARKICDLVLENLGRSGVPCTTATRLLPGGVAGSFSEYLSHCREEAHGLLPYDVLEHLVLTYGAKHQELLARVKRDSSLGERIKDGRPEILAQVAHAVESEMALTLGDIVFRRTGIGTLGHVGDSALSKVIELARSLLGWDDQRVEREKEIYFNKIKGLPEPPL